MGSLSHNDYKAANMLRTSIKCLYGYGLTKPPKEVYLLRHAESVYNFKTNQFPEAEVYGKQAQ